MSPRTKDQFKAMRGKSRENIINSAMSLFATNGFHTTSMAQISSAAGISKGLIYNYYFSKEALLDAIIQNGFSEIDLMLNENLSDLNPKEELISQITQAFQAYQTNFDFWKLYFQIIMQPAIFSKYSKQLQKFLNGQIIKMTNLFTSAGISHPEYRARIVAALLDGIGFHLIIDPNYPLEDIKRYIIQEII